MNKRLNALKEMLEECSACMERNAEKIANYAPLVTATGTLNTRIAVIRQTITEHEQNITGIAAEKKVKRKQMAELTDALRLKVQAVVLSHDDVIGYKAANFCYSKIYNASAGKAMSYAEIVFRLASALSDEDKENYQITADELELQNGVTTEFRVLNTERRSGIVIKATTGEVLAELVRDTCIFVRTTMSGLMGNYKVTDKTFFREWEHAKKVSDPIAHRAQITGIVTDQETLQPLQMVKVVATDGTRVYEDMSNSEGKYKLPVNPDMWNVSFELPSYVKTDKTNIAVESGERQILNVTLAPS